MKKKEYKMVDKYGEFIYKYGTKYEVADYALRHQMLMVADEDKKWENQNLGYILMWQK